MQGVMATWMGWSSTPRKIQSDSDSSDELEESAKDSHGSSDITFASLDASYKTARLTKVDQLDKSFAVIKDHINVNDLDISDIKDINHEFDMNAPLSDSVGSLDESRTGSGDESKTSLMENWNKKFDEWRTPKKEQFLAKLIKTINITEEWMKNHTGGVLYLNENNSATHPEERQRSSINGRVVDGFPIRHPAAPKKEPVPTTERDPFSRQNKNSLSNDSLAFTLVYCSVFLVTLFYIGYKLTKKWRNQDELESAGGVVHLTGANGYVCNHTLCREARQRNQALYGSVDGPHNTARCGNSCENCRRMSQPPPSYSKLSLDETEPPAYTDDMDRECACRRSQNSRASLCLYQTNGDTSQEIQDLQRSASVAIMTNTSSGSPRSEISTSAPLTGAAGNLTSVTVHTAPSYIMQPVPSYAEFPKPGERKKAGHTRRSMENIPGNIGPISTPRVVHHPIFTVDEEESDEEMITVNTPILSSNNSLHTTDNPTINVNSNANPDSINITNERIASSVSSENVVNNVLTNIVNNAVTNMEDTETKAANCTQESKQTTADIITAVADVNTEAVAVASAPQAAECVNATSAVESSSIIIEKSR